MVAVSALPNVLGLYVHCHPLWLSEVKLAMHNLIEMPVVGDKRCLLDRIQYRDAESGAVVFRVEHLPTPLHSEFAK